MEFPTIFSTPDPNELHVPIKRMRYAVGVLAIALPIVVALGATLFGACKFPLPSISHYYFTSMGDVFVAILSIIGFFLALYNPDRTENWLTNIIAVCLFLIAFFPTNYVAGDLGSCGVIGMPNAPWRGVVHYAAAVLGFSLLAYMAYFRFPSPHHANTINWIFKSQAMLMVVLMLFFGVSKFLLKLPEEWNLTYWVEFALLLIFGNLWLMKGYHGD